MSFPSYLWLRFFFRSYSIFNVQLERQIDKVIETLSVKIFHFHTFHLFLVKNKSENICMFNNKRSINIYVQLNILKIRYTLERNVRFFFYFTLNIHIYMGGAAFLSAPLTSYLLGLLVIYIRVNYSCPLSREAKHIWNEDGYIYFYIINS